MEDLFIEDYIDKLALLAERTGASIPHELLEPFSVEAHDIVAIQAAAKKIGSFVGLDNLIFVVTVVKQKQNVAGNIDLSQDGADVFIELASETRAFPQSVLATLAHEIAHKWLQINKISWGNSLLDHYHNEILTDITTIWLGLGKLSLNGCENSSRSSEGVGANKRTVMRTFKCGYLNRKQFGFVYLLCCAMRKVEHKYRRSGLNREVLRILDVIEGDYKGFFSDKRYQGGTPQFSEPESPLTQKKWLDEARRWFQNDMKAGDTSPVEENNQTVPQPNTPLPAEAQMYYLHYGGENHGPYVIEQIKSMWAAGAIPADAMYWTGAEETGWRRVIELISGAAQPSQSDAIGRGRKESGGANTPKAKGATSNPTTPRPWRRLWARSLDNLIYSMALSPITVVIWRNFDVPVAMLAGALFGIPFFAIAEATFLSSTGTTLGKGLLGIRVTNHDGVHLSFGQAVSRNLSIVWRGILVIPFFIAYSDLKNLGATKWDRRGQFTVPSSQISGWRWLAYAAVFAFINSINAHVNSPMTEKIAQFSTAFWSGFFRNRDSSPDSHVVLDSAGKRIPAPGYTWAHPDDPNDLTVTPVATAEQTASQEQQTLQAQRQTVLDQAVSLYPSMKDRTSAQFRIARSIAMDAATAAPGTQEYEDSHAADAPMRFAQQAAEQLGIKPVGTAPAPSSILPQPEPSPTPEQVVDLPSDQLDQVQGLSVNDIGGGVTVHNDSDFRLRSVDFTITISNAAGAPPYSYRFHAVAQSPCEPHTQGDFSFTPFNNAQLMNSLNYVSPTESWRVVSASGVKP